MGYRWEHTSGGREFVGTWRGWVDNSPAALYKNDPLAASEECGASQPVSEDYQMET